MPRLAAVYDRLIDTLALAGGFLMAGMAVWTTYEVAMRYFWARPTSWAVDLSEYSMLWATFLAGPWLLRQEGHVRIEALVERLPPRGQQVLGIAVSLLGAAVCFVLAWRTALTTYDFYVRGMVTNREWQIPEFLPYVSIPLGSLLLAVEFLRRANRYRRAPDGEAGLKQPATTEPHL